MIIIFSSLQHKRIQMKPLFGFISHYQWKKKTRKNVFLLRLVRYRRIIELHWNCVLNLHSCIWSYFLFSFFPWFQYDVFLCKVFCVSYLINSWGIFFLKKEICGGFTRSNTKSYLCEISKTQSREKCKRYDCVHVCVWKYEKPCVWSKGDASAV